MSLLCIICGDSILSQGRRPQPSPATAYPVALAGCGHIFHHECILKWFSGLGGHGSIPGTGGACPTCKRISALEESLRIYPASEESDLRDAQSKINELTAQKEELSKKIATMDPAIEDAKNKYREYEMKLVKALSTIDKLGQELEFAKNMLKAMSESVRMANRRQAGFEAPRASNQPGNDIEVVWESNSNSNPPPPPVAGPSRQLTKRSYFIFAIKDEMALQSFVEQTLKANPWGHNNSRQIAEAFTRSPYYREMTRGRGEPAKSSLERRIREICAGMSNAKGVAKDSSDSD